MLFANFAETGSIIRAQNFLLQKIVQNCTWYRYRTIFFLDQFK